MKSGDVLFSTAYFQFRRHSLVLALGLILVTTVLLVTVFGLSVLPAPGRWWLAGASLVLLLLIAGVASLIVFDVFKPIQTLIRETEETLQGIRKGGISLVRDDEIGVLANNFNQIILDAQMKRVELENSNRELASHSQIIEKTYRELDKKVYDLFTLFNIGKELNSTLSVEAIMKITCFTSMGQMGVTSMTLLLLEERENRMLVRYIKGLRKDPDRPDSLQLDEAFLDFLCRHEGPLTLSELEGLPEFRAALEQLSPFKTFMIAPLMAKDQIIGMLLLGRKLSGEDYSKDEKDFVNTLTSLSALALRNARHYEQAITDEMTQLYLKRYFQLRLEDEFKRAARYHNRLTLMMLDIDHFKRINDTYGHTKGDEILIRVAKAIKENFRDVDIPARYGGEEFSVIMPEVSKEEALIPAERLRKTVEAIDFVLNGDHVTVTVSIGLAEFPHDAQMPLQLIEASDAALYRSKENGRNQTTLA